MSESLDIYNEKQKLIKERIKLKSELEANENKIKTLQENCNHKLILKFCDHKPHKIGIIYECICPFCGKREDIYPSHELENSSFNNSKVIDLSKHHLFSIMSLIPSICDYVVDNFNELDDDYLNEYVDENVKKLNKKSKE